MNSNEKIDGVSALQRLKNSFTQYAGILAALAVIIVAAAITAADATVAVIDRRRLRHRTRRAKVYVIAECGNDVRIAAAFPALSERLTMYLDAVLLRRDGGLLRRSGV